MSIDRFRQPRMQDVGERFNAMRAEHQRVERAMWIGSLLLEFDTFEIGILRDMGFLSMSDESMLRKIDRN